jgi:hypothetical protein
MVLKTTKKGKNVPYDRQEIYANLIIYSQESMISYIFIFWQVGFLQYIQDKHHRQNKIYIS